MHYIQKHILDELRTADSARYAQLNPDEIESGHFRYHLSQLIKEGYVEQLERGLYRLTTNGQHYVDKLSEHRVTTIAMPKVITYTLLRDGETVILQKKHKQPYMGLFNMVGGKLHEGETAEQAAVREVQEKTGTKIAEPKLEGVFEVLVTTETELLTHVVAYVFVAAVRATDYTSPAYAAIPEQQLFEATELAPDFLPIFTEIQAATGVCVKTLAIRV